MRGLTGAGPDLVKGANAMLGKGALQDESWPYFWEQPRANAEHAQPVNSIPVPVIGVITEVVNVTVPAGFRFVLRKIMHTFTSTITPSPWQEGSGDLLFTIDVDNPIGSVALASFALPDMANMAQSRGSLVNGPWPVEGYNVFNPYQVIRYKVVNVAIAAGAPNLVHCGLFGWWQPLLDAQG